jgi:hypothetical protein
MGAATEIVSIESNLRGAALVFVSALATAAPELAQSARLQGQERPYQPEVFVQSVEMLA